MLGAPPGFITDVIFLIDSSWQVNRRNFKLEKDFVKHMARLLNVQRGESRAAMVTYGVNPRTVFRYGDHVDRSGLENAVNNAPYIGGVRRMDLALSATRQLLSEARPDVKKTVVLVTAGREGIGASPLDPIARQIRESGAKTYVVAIGNSPNMEELQPVVQNQADIFPVYSFVGLRPKAPPIARHIANSK